MAFTGNAPQNVAANFVTPVADTAYLDFDYFAKSPDLIKTVYESWDNKGFVDMLALTGREEVVRSETFSNYETGLLARSFAVQTATSPTAGSVIITLTSDSLTTVNSTTGPIARSPLMENFTIKLPNRKEAFVQFKSSVNGGATGAATTYTLVKSDLAADAAFDLGAYFVSVAGTGQRFSGISSAFGEDTDEALEGIENPMTRYVGYLQIVKSHSAITGSAAGDAWNVTLPGGVNRWYSKQRLEQGIHHRQQEGMQMIVGAGGKFKDKSNKVVQTSMGLEGYLRSYGNIYDYAPTGFSAADLDALTNRMKTIMGGTEYQWIMGSALHAAVSTVIRNIPGLTNGGIRYDSFGKSNAAAKALDLGFNSIIWNGITLHLQETSVFDHPELLGLAGYNYTNMGFLIPGAKQRITTSDNGVSASFGGSVDAESLRIRYKEDVGGKSRRYLTYDRGIEITGRDRTNHECLSHCGLQMVGLRRFILVQKGA